jgi:hypothetical protein
LHLQLPRGKEQPRRFLLRLDFPFLDHKITLILTNFTLCNFRLEPSSHQCQSPPNASSIGMTFPFIIYFFRDHYPHWHLPLIWHLQKKYWWITLWKPPPLGV